MTQTKLKINVRETLRFFDEAPLPTRGHATAIVSMIGEDLGAALFQRYLYETRGMKTTVIQNDGVPRTPTRGKKTGHRLDRWILETTANKKKRLYQVEIKNWSAHAIGGEPLLIKASPSEMKIYRKKRWFERWDKKQKRFKDISVSKVLERMKPPDDIEGEFLVMPVICFWTAVHPSGKPDPIFEQQLKRPINHFNKVTVFSMSNYMRMISKRTIELEMPSTTMRLFWLKKLLVNVAE